MYEFYLKLQLGITGGFAPPSPSAVHIITSSDPHFLSLSSALRPNGSPDLQYNPQSSLPRTHADPLLDELHAILKQIPTESPPGSQDIYAMDTSIAWGSSDLEWANGGPQGCTGAISTVQPTDDDKEKFKRAVDIVNELLNLQP